MKKREEGAIHKIAADEERQSYFAGILAPMWPMS